VILRGIGAKSETALTQYVTTVCVGAPPAYEDLLNVPRKRRIRSDHAVHLRLIVVSA